MSIITLSAALNDTWDYEFGFPDSVFTEKLLLPSRNLMVRIMRQQLGLISPLYIRVTISDKPFEGQQGKLTFHIKNKYILRYISEEKYLFPICETSILRLFGYNPDEIYYKIIKVGN